ncbi:MAG: hypothetical protein R2862_10885 [Thermoanaerobaculia bacterium]
MVELALLAARPELRVSGRELTLGRPAYTIETVEALRSERPGDELVLLVGLDSFLELPTWRRFGDLLEAVPLGVLTRPGYGLAESAAEDLAPELRGAIARGTVRPSWRTPRSRRARRRSGAGSPPASPCPTAGWIRRC